MSEATDIRCRDGCGASVPAAGLDASGWERLPIQNRYRCVACWSALKDVNRLEQA